MEQMQKKGVSWCQITRTDHYKDNVYTFMILEPSRRYLMRFPTISAGYTTSSRMASWTAVRVRERGRTMAEPFLGGFRILRVAISTTSYQTNGQLIKSWQMLKKESNMHLGSQNLQSHCRYHNIFIEK